MERFDSISQALDFLISKGMVLQIVRGSCEEEETVREELDAVKTQVSAQYDVLDNDCRSLTATVARLKECALQLSVMNVSLLNHTGDLSEKSLKNFTAEIKRLTGEMLAQPPAQDGATQ